MNQTEDGLFLQKGFLKEDFLFFHLKDQQSLTIETHYHDFHKLVLFYAGEVTYAIEGKYYKLRPGDILFIANHALHKPIISASSPYERIILLHPIFIMNLAFKHLLTISIATLQKIYPLTI